MNGVCVQLKGWIDIKRLDGIARLEFDYDLADVSLLSNSPLHLIISPSPILLISSLSCSKNSNLSAPLFSLADSAKLPH